MMCQFSNKTVAVMHSRQVGSSIYTHKVMAWGMSGCITWLYFDHMDKRCTKTWLSVVAWRVHFVWERLVKMELPASPQVVKEQLSDKVAVSCSQLIFLPLPSKPSRVARPQVGVCRTSLCFRNLWKRKNGSQRISILYSRCIAPNT